MWYRLKIYLVQGNHCRPCEKQFLRSAGGSNKCTVGLRSQRRWENVSRALPATPLVYVSRMKNIESPLFLFSHLSSAAHSNCTMTLGSLWLLLAITSKRATLAQCWYSHTTTPFLFIENHTRISYYLIPRINSTCVINRPPQ